MNWIVTIISLLVGTAVTLVTITASVVVFSAVFPLFIGFVVFGVIYFAVLGKDFPN